MSFFVVSKRVAGCEKVDLKGQDIILAFGESSGHAHRIKPTDAAIYTEPTSGRRFVEVNFNKPALLTHEEHDTLVLPQGTYEVIQQRTKSVEEELTRRVAD